MSEQRDPDDGLLTTAALTLQLFTGAGADADIPLGSAEDFLASVAERLGADESFAEGMIDAVGAVVCLWAINVSERDESTSEVRMWDVTGRAYASFASTDQCTKSIPATTIYYSGGGSSRVGYCAHIPVHIYT